MATTHISFNDGTRWGRQLRNVLDNLERGLDEGNDLLAVMTHMIDGDGSNASHFDLVTTNFGFADNAHAKAAWDELNSMMFKLNTNSSVSDVNAALLQAFAKMG